MLFRSLKIIKCKNWANEDRNPNGLSREYKIIQGHNFIYRSEWSIPFSEIGGKVNAIHKDYFDIFDLISFDGKDFIGHQISTIENKAAKVRAIQNKGMKGWVWCRVSEIGRKVGYRIFLVDREIVEEGEIIWKG